MARRRHPVLPFTGAGVAKLAPPLVQFVLLLLVARAGSLDDVGRLALASAGAFLCGALAELGLATSLSIPKVTFGTEGVPLRATRRLRLTAAVLGCFLYVTLWAAGLGGHDPVLLLVAPLPFALALAYGYAGAMNASGELHYEIPVSLGESALVLASALLVAAVYAPLLRTAYSTLLSAEALSWSLFGGANPDEHERSSRLGQTWRPLTMVLG